MKFFIPEDGGNMFLQNVFIHFNLTQFQNPEARYPKKNPIPVRSIRPGLSLSFTWLVFSSVGQRRFSPPAIQDELCRDLPAAENCILSHHDPLFEENSVPNSKDHTPR